MNCSSQTYFHSVSILSKWYQKVIKYSNMSSSLIQIIRNEVPCQDRKRETSLAIVYSAVCYILNPKPATYASPSTEIPFTWFELL